MGKRDDHRQDLSGFFDEFCETGDSGGLIEYIVSNSALPGPRANLELAAAFGDAVADRAGEQAGRLWALCTGLAAISADEAPVNDPQEFLPFCGAVAVGALGSVTPKLFEQALTALRRSARDPRWRTREATCFGLQRLLAARGQESLRALEGWVADGHPLEMRAVAAGVAAPVILKDGEVAAAALQLHRAILDQVLQIQERNAEDFQVLRKGLGFTLSVVVQAAPEEGFEFLTQLAGLRDRDVLWIVKQNLKKNRLVKNFPEQVEALKRLLQ